MLIIEMSNLIIFAFWAFCMSQTLCAQSLLPPPFGLQWGDQPDKILDWAEAKKLDVVIKIPGSRPEIREIRVSAERGALPGHQAFALEARYHWGNLFEVTVHYGAPGMKPREIKSSFEKLKKAMEIKYGVFVPNNKQEKKGEGFVRNSVSYHVEPVSGLLLLLAYTELEDLQRKKNSARFSLLYRNDNIIPKK